MNKKEFLAIGIFWLVIILGFVSFKEFTLKTGEELMLKTRPVDPRDLFRGDYIVLDYEISRLDINSLQTDAISFNESDRVYVALSNEEGYGIASGVYKNRPKGLFLKGTVKRTDGSQITIEYGIESYFVPEGEGLEIQRQSRRGLEAKVAIDKFGNAVLKSIFLNGNEVEFNRDGFIDGI